MDDATTVHGPLQMKALPFGAGPTPTAGEADE